VTKKEFPRTIDKNGLREYLKLSCWDYNPDDDIFIQLEKEYEHLLKILEAEREADMRNSYWATDSLLRTNRRIKILCEIAFQQGYKKGKEAKENDN